MDGRKALLCVCACASALTFGASGCVPGSAKITSVEASRPTPTPEPDEPPARGGLFGAAKREPRVELALANWREKKAQGLRDNPELQYRELDDARRIYQEILNYDPNQLEALRGLGRTYVALSDYDRATAVFLKAIEKFPREGVVYAEYSIIFSKRNRFDEAIRQMQKAVELDPENQDHQRMLGINLVCAGQLDAGVQALARARGPAAAHYYVARLLARQGKTDVAREHLNKALEVNANLSEARTFLAELDRGPSATDDASRPILAIEFLTDAK